MSDIEEAVEVAVVEASGEGDENDAFVSVEVVDEEPTGADAEGNIANTDEDDSQAAECLDASMDVEEESLDAEVKPNSVDSSDEPKAKNTKATPAKRKASDDASATPHTETKKRKRKASPKKQKSGEIPSVKDLGIPFRAVKRLMKIDKDIVTVQNEAAMVATYAVELFVEKIVKESNENAKKRGRNTVKYEDLGEVRVSNKNLSFLDTLIP